MSSSLSDDVTSDVTVRLSPAWFAASGFPIVGISGVGIKGLGMLSVVDDVAPLTSADDDVIGLVLWSDDVVALLTSSSSSLIGPRISRILWPLFLVFGCGGGNRNGVRGNRNPGEPEGRLGKGNAGIVGDLVRCDGEFNVNELPK